MQPTSHSSVRRRVPLAPGRAAASRLPTLALAALVALALLAKALELERKKQGTRVVGRRREEKFCGADLDGCADGEAADGARGDDGAQRARRRGALRDEGGDVIARLREVKLQLARAEDLQGKGDLVRGC